MVIATPAIILVAQPAGGGFVPRQAKSLFISTALVEQLFGNAALLAIIGLFSAIISGVFS